MVTRSAPFLAALPLSVVLGAPAWAAAAGPPITPSNGDTVTSRTVTVGVSAPSFGGKLIVDGVVRDTGSGRLTYTIDGTRTANGTHTVRFDANASWDDDSTSTFKMSVRPSAPDGVKATSSGRTVTVRWTANPEPDITGYQIASPKGGGEAGACSGSCQFSFDVPQDATGVLAVGVDAVRAGTDDTSPTSYVFVKIDDPAPVPPPAPDPQPEQPEQPAPNPAPNPQPQPSVPSASPSPSKPGKPGKPSSPGSTTTTTSPSSTAPGTTPSTTPSIPPWLGPLLTPTPTPGASGPPILPTVGSTDPTTLPTLPQQANLASNSTPQATLDERTAQGTAIGFVLVIGLAHIGTWTRRHRMRRLALTAGPTARERIQTEQLSITAATEAARQPAAKKKRRWRREAKTGQ